MYNFDFSILLDNYKSILEGIAVTLEVSFMSALLAFFVGSVFVYFRIYPQSFIRGCFNFFVSCLRNTPLLIVIYLFYKGLPSFGMVLGAMTCGVLALGLYSAAYVSDAILSGVNAVPKEHSHAAMALGLSRIQTFLYIIYPQALRHSTFILGSQFMNLLKNSSLVSFIAVADVFYVVYKGISDTYRIYEYFLLAVVIYSVMSLFVLFVTNILKRKFSQNFSEVRE